MNSTEDAGPLDIRQFFYKEIMPIAKKLKSEGKILLRTGFDPEAETYFSKHQKNNVAPGDFELACGNAAELAEALGELFRSEGSLELVPLVPKLIGLAQELRPEVKQDEDVSPFIYVMF